MWRRLIWPSRWWGRVLALGVYALLFLSIVAAVAGPRDHESAAARRCYNWADPKIAAHSNEAQPSEVTHAYRIIVDCYYEPPDGTLLLTAAWDGAVEAAHKAGAQTSDVPAPVLVGDYNKDAAIFDAEFPRLIESLRSQVSRDDLIYAAILAMTASLKDAHTGYLPPAFWKISPRAAKGDTPDGGFSYVYRKEGVLVWEVVKDSSADKAGLRPGDLITAINGTPVYRYTSTQSPAIGRAIEYTVQRQSGDEVSEVEVALVLQALRPRMATAVLDDNVAYVRLNTFLTTLTDFQRDNDPALGTLRDRAPAGWILDLRGNPGGSSIIAQHVAQAFGLRGTLAVYQDRFHPASGASQTTPSLTDGKPVVILVDEQSASASELVAGGFQDGHAGYVIGARTAGHANASGSVYIVAGGGLSVTESRAFIAGSHRSLEGSGVVPDEDVRLTAEALAAGHDAQLERAIAYIRSRQPAATAAR